MSQSTPSKQDRYERHLMRQRGAGARLITADFGFAFAFGSPSPRDYALVERPEKRRKTNERPNADIETVVRQTATPACDDVCVDKSENRKRSKKPKRRLPVDLEGDRAPSVDKGIDDSFAVQAKSKKSGPTQRKDRPIAVSKKINPTVSAGKAAAKDRAKRRADAGAASTVSQHRTEEGEPVNKRRTDEEPKNAVREPRRKEKDIGKNNGSEVPDAASAVVPEEASPKQRHINVTRTARTSGRQAGALKGSSDVGVHEAGHEPHLVEVEISQKKGPVDVHEESDQAKSRKQRPTKQKPTSAKACKATRSKPRMEEIIKSTKMSEDRMEPHASCDEARIASLHQQADYDCPIERGALQEADVNVVRPSVSPVKHEKTLDVAESPKRPAARRKRVEKDKLESSQSTKRRKLHIERDNPGQEGVRANFINSAIDSASMNPLSTVTRESANVGVSLNDKRRTLRESAKSIVPKRTSGSPIAPEFTNSPSKKGKNGKPESHQKTDGTQQATMATKDDIDWLFAPQSPTHPLGKTSKLASKTQQQRKNCTRLPDIDLDDLVTNIASFAPAAPNTDVGGSQNMRATRARGRQ